MEKHRRLGISGRLVLLAAGLVAGALIAWQVTVAVQIGVGIYTYNPFAVFLSFGLFFISLFWWWGPGAFYLKIVDVLYYTIGAVGVALLAQSFQGGVQRTAVEMAFRVADRDADVLDRQCEAAMLFISFREVDRAGGELIAGVADMRSLCGSIGDATSAYRDYADFLASIPHAVEGGTRSDILRYRNRGTGTYDRTIRLYMDGIVEAFDTFEASLVDLKLATEMNPFYFVFEPKTSSSGEERVARALEFYAPLMVLFALALKLAKSIEAIRWKG